LEEAALVVVILEAVEVLELLIIQLQHFPLEFILFKLVVVEQVEELESLQVVGDKEFLLIL